MIEAICNGSAASELSDGYMDTDGYGIFELLPGFWGLFTLMMLWTTALPFAELRDNLVFEMTGTYGFIPPGDRSKVTAQAPQCPSSQFT